MRINRYLALCGLGSRRAVEGRIRAGRVRVNGAVAGMASAVGEKDRVEVDGRPAAPPPEHIYLVLNKPPGTLCSRGDTHGRETIYGLLPPEHRRLHYVGRLDRESRGLLLLTDDGALTQSLTHPSREVLREYAVAVDASLSQGEMRRLERGVETEPGTVLRCAFIRGEGGGYRLGLREGKKREIRRLLSALGRRVTDLQRVAFGGIGLGRLPEGAFRPLSEEELAKLRSAARGKTRG